ncbi:hypothetical protein M8J76_010921 [Diaphorina citri]|nr:hypothetical protein M8J76_010921 [Diaphorina citri]
MVITYTYKTAENTTDYRNLPDSLNEASAGESGLRGRRASHPSRTHDLYVQLPERNRTRQLGQREEAVLQLLRSSQ